MTVRLVDEQPCPTCGGSGELLDVPGTWIRTDDGMKLYQPKCSDCDGKGVCVSPVSCAECRWWGMDNWCPAYTKGDEAETPNATFGCLSWTAKEGTDGR